MNQEFPVAALAVIATLTAVGIVALVAVVVRRNRSREIAVDRAQLDALRNEWRGPAELMSKSTPRDVRYTGKAYALFALAGTVIGAGVVGAILLYPGIQRDIDHARLLEREGVASHGTIVDRSVSHGKSDSYSVTYEYQVDGRQFRASARVPGEEYQQLDIGAQAPIHHAVSQPEVSRADVALNDPPLLRFLVLMPGLFLLILPAMARYQKNLLALGTPAGAIVSRVAQTKGGRAIRFHYLDATGTVTSGQDVVSSRTAPSVGDVVPIVFDPEHPRRCKMYPLALVRLDD